MRLPDDDQMYHANTDSAPRAPLMMHTFTFTVCLRDCSFDWSVGALSSVLWRYHQGALHLS